MKHLQRAGVLLLVILVVVFVVPRAIPPTAFLDAYGFYPKQSEKNAQEWAMLPVKYADVSTCSSCHTQNYRSWETSKHATVNCQNCHGPAIDHIEKSVIPAVDTSRESCGLCHATIIGRPDSFPQIDLGEHGGQSDCITCHDPHNPQLASLGEITPKPEAPQTPKDLPAATLPKIPHTLQGRSECLLCHNTGGLKPFPQSHEGRGQDTCLNCHNAG